MQTLLTNNAGRWFAMGTPTSSTNKTTEILLKVALNTIT